MVDAALFATGPALSRADALLAHDGLPPDTGRPAPYRPREKPDEPADLRSPPAVNQVVHHQPDASFIDGRGHLAGECRSISRAVAPMEADQEFKPTGLRQRCTNAARPAAKMASPATTATTGRFDSVAPRLLLVVPADSASARMGKFNFV